MKLILIFIFYFTILGSFISSYPLDFSQRADTHAPIGIMADHWHSKGELMASYRAMYMSMDTLSEAPQGMVMKTPNSMVMKMHMFGVMYAPSDKFTVMAMTHLLDKSMTSINNSGVSSKVYSNGISDVLFSGLIPLFNSISHKMHISSGISLPTGKIDQKQENMTLGYGMQNGSGTYDLVNSVSSVYYWHFLSLGNQFSSIYRLGENSKGYRLGHKIQLNSWVSKPWNEVISNSLRLSYTLQDRVDGQHNDISNINMNPSMNPANTGFEQFMLSLGANTKLDKIGVPGARLALEYNIPFSQSYNGSQLKDKETFTFGYQQKF